MAISDVIRAHGVKSLYSRRSLSRTPTGPMKMFEITKVRDNGRILRG